MICTFVLKSGVWKKISYWRVGLITSILEDGCMDVSMIDGVDIGTEVVLLGRSGTEQITADDLANAYGTIGYEIVCGINKRVKRMYLEKIP